MADIASIAARRETALTKLIENAAAIGAALGIDVPSIPLRGQNVAFLQMQQLESVSAFLESVRDKVAPAKDSNGDSEHIRISSVGHIEVIHPVDGYDVLVDETLHRAKLAALARENGLPLSENVTRLEMANNLIAAGVLTVSNQRAFLDAVEKADADETDCLDDVYFGELVDAADRDALMKQLSDEFTMTQLREAAIAHDMDVPPNIRKHQLIERMVDAGFRGKKPVQSDEAFIRLDDTRISFEALDFEQLLTRGELSHRNLVAVARKHKLPLDESHSRREVVEHLIKTGLLETSDNPALLAAIDQLPDESALDPNETEDNMPLSDDERAALAKKISKESTLAELIEIAKGQGVELVDDMKKSDVVNRLIDGGYRGWADPADGKAEDDDNGGNASDE